MDLAFCSRCGRLLADEPGELCDHCDPSLRHCAALTEAASRMRNPVTWALIALAILATSVAHATAGNGLLPGSAFGPAVLHGHWWLLITELFVHFNAAHLVGNLIFLWLFGKRVERILGSKTFLALCMACGLASGIATLTLEPEAYSCGISGVVFGLAGTLLTFYGSRFKTLSGKQRIKWMVLLLWSGLGFYSGFHHPRFEYLVYIDNVAHVAGFCAGILLGTIFGLRTEWDRRAKSYLFGGACAVLFALALTARVYNGYAVDLDAAMRDLDAGRGEDAIRELQIALNARPGSDLAKSLLPRAEEVRKSTPACLRLPLNPVDPKRLRHPCSDLLCDDKIHLLPASDSMQAYYVGSKQTDVSHMRENATITFTEKLAMQCLDRYGNIACTTHWEKVTTWLINKEDANGAFPEETSEKITVIPASDPAAKSLRERFRSAGSLSGPLHSPIDSLGSLH